MSTRVATRVCGLAKSLYQTDQIVRVLNENGFERERIAVLFPDWQDTCDFAAVTHTRLPPPGIERVKVGGMLSGPLGWGMGLSLLGWILGLGVLIDPATGLMPPGPLLEFLPSPLLGILVGAMTGALIGVAVSEVKSKEYEAKIRAGNIFLSIDAHDPPEIVRIDGLLDLCGAKDICHAATGSAIKAAYRPIAAQPADNLR